MGLLSIFWPVSWLINPAFIISTNTCFCLSLAFSKSSYGEYKLGAAGKPAKNVASALFISHTFLPKYFKLASSTPYASPP